MTSGPLGDSFGSHANSPEGSAPEGVANVVPLASDKEIAIAIKARIQVVILMYCRDHSSRSLVGFCEKLPDSCRTQQQSGPLESLAPLHPCKKSTKLRNLCKAGQGVRSHKWSRRKPAQFNRTPAMNPTIHTETAATRSHAIAENIRRFRSSRRPRR